MTGRGVLTTKVRVKALETLGREITTAELRRQAGWIEGGASSRIIIKRDFWRAITELLYFAYIAEAD
jgi:hypothetical protein